MRRFQQYRDIGAATFPLHQRGLDIFGGLAIVMLIGISVTGVWQFFAHESDPDWYDYVPDSGFSVPQQPSVGAAQAHGLFGLGAGIVALLGTAWFAYRIAHRVPLASLSAFACILFATLTEALVRFNVIKLEGRTLDQADAGYTQLITGNVEYVVTDAGQTGAAPLLILLATHIVTLPILVGFAWWSIVRALDRRTFEIANAPERTWFKTIGKS